MKSAFPYACTSTEVSVTRVGAIDDTDTRAWMRLVRRKSVVNHVYGSTAHGWAHAMMNAGCMQATVGGKHD